MTEREITSELRRKYYNRRTIRGYKLRARYGRDWDTLTAELKRTREKLDILMDMQRDMEQRRIAEYCEAKK